jgi:hypothetical protein
MRMCYAYTCVEIRLSGACMACPRWIYRLCALCVYACVLCVYMCGNQTKWSPYGMSALDITPGVFMCLCVCLLCVYMCECTKCGIYVLLHTQITYLVYIFTCTISIPCINLRISLPGIGSTSSKVSVAVFCIRIRARWTDWIAFCCIVNMHAYVTCLCMPCECVICMSRLNVSVRPFFYAYSLQRFDVVYAHVELTGLLSVVLWIGICT